jgi:YesN/AraC family two-component response regulator
MPQYKNNIRKVWSLASKSEIASGIYWYPQAAKVASEISEEFDIPQDRVCLVISALSPNNNWSRNISDAWKVCRVWSSERESKRRFFTFDKSGIDIAEWYKQAEKQRKECATCTYPANKEKAFAILDGKLDHLKGLKTQNFARNLQGCEESVTVDVHAFSIANGKRYTAKTVKPISKTVYEKISQAYTDVANEIDITPAQLQAITWQTWRRINGLTSARELTGKLF